MVLSFLSPLAPVAAKREHHSVLGLRMSNTWKAPDEAAHSEPAYRRAPARSDIASFCEQALGDANPTAVHVRGFVEGAAEVFDML